MNTPLELPGDWARDIAAVYRKIAEESRDYPLRAIMNFHEAAKYENLASRMDSAT